MSDERNIAQRHRFGGLTQQDWNWPVIAVVVGLVALWGGFIELVVWVARS